MRTSDIINEFQNKITVVLVEPVHTNDVLMRHSVREVSPILWALLNQLLRTALGDKCHGIILISVDGVEEHVRPVNAFVDDTKTGVTNDDTTIEQVDA
jgi:hypothetical protein